MIGTVSKHHVKAFVFDLFGTLISHYSVKLNERFLSDASGIVGIENAEFAEAWNSDMHASLIGKYPTVRAKFEGVLAQIGKKVPESEMLALVEPKRKHVAEHFELAVDVLPTLNYLRERGYKIQLLSGCGPDMRLVWDESPLSTCFPEPVFSFEVGVTKPTPRVYEIAFQSLSLSPEECVYVGDGSGEELTGATNVGMTAIRIMSNMEDVYDPWRRDVQQWEGAGIERIGELTKHF